MDGPWVPTIFLLFGNPKFVVPWIFPMGPCLSVRWGSVQSPGIPLKSICEVDGDSAGVSDPYGDRHVFFCLFFLDVPFTSSRVAHVDHVNTYTIFFDFIIYTHFSHGTLKDSNYWFAVVLLETSSCFLVDAWSRSCVKKLIPPTWFRRCWSW